MQYFPVAIFLAAYTAAATTAVAADMSLLLY